MLTPHATPHLTLSLPHSLLPSPHCRLRLVVLWSDSREKAAMSVGL